MPKAAPPAPALFEEGELPPMPGKLEQQAFDVYNEIADKAGWTKATKLTPDRARKLKRAVHEVGSLVEWRAALERGSRSTFLTTKFKPDFEFVTRLPKLLKMAEGGFDDPGAQSNGPLSISKQSDPTDQWGRWLRDYKLKSFWPSHLGPRPEQPGCRAPREMVAVCLKRLGVTVQAPVSETREQRLVVMIASYRRIGNYARANKFEQELADIEKRPAVLVPDPSVAQCGMPEKPAVARPQPVVSDVIDEYDAVPEGEQYEEA